MHPALKAILGGTAATVATMLAHGPFGLGEATIGRIERQAQAIVAKMEVPGTSVAMGRNPLRRDALLSGPADDFQRGGLTDCVAPIEGVRKTAWADGASPAPSGRPCGGGIG